MSRPPRPHFRESTTGAPAVRQGRLVVAPDKFGELVKLQQRIAADEALVSIAGAEGDFAQTAIELSALLGHALAVYQDLFASEAYLGTAQMSASLVLHARRLAYEPDVGVAAAGYLVLEVGAGLSGTLPEGFSLASVPHGDQKAQDYETLDDVLVNAAWNDLRPVDNVKQAEVAFAAGQATLRVTGTGFDLQPGDRTLLVGATRRLDLTVVSAAEDPDREETLVTVSGGPAVPPFDASGHVFYAKPDLPVHLFGWNAPGASFSPAALQSDGSYVPLDPDDASVNVGDTTSGYTVSGPAGGYNSLDIYLDQEVRDPLAGTYVLLRTSLLLSQACRVDAQVTANVTYTRGEIIGITITTFTNGTPSTSTRKQLVENSISGSVSTVRLTSLTGAVQRTSIPVPFLSHGLWRVQAPLAATEPNPAPVGDYLDVPADLTAVRPGRPMALATLDETTAQVVEVRKFELQPSGATRVWWTGLTPLPSGFQWVLSDVRLLGNVARISHGKRVEETVGSSDGVTPFQQFALKKTPLTRLAAAGGATPELEVRVNGIAWRSVPDFYDSGARDRVYRLSVNEAQETTVIFGDGRKGAVPPSGKKNITATYRTGLGTSGNAAEGQVSRIRKTHPLIETARNLTEANGGADPASLEDVRSLAVKYIRTFDRAVSVQDHADLALLFPGVARAGARWDDVHGVQLVAATADGSALASRQVLRDFLDLRRDTEIRLTLLDPQPVDVFLTLAIEHGPEYLTEAVKNAVQDAFFGASALSPGMFTFAARQFGQPAFLSEVFRVSEAIEGVTFVDVTRFSLSAPPAVFDTLKATASQWLRLQPQNLELGATPGVPA
jgi:hypothetical protein